LIDEAKKNPWFAALILAALGLGGGNIALRPEAGVTADEVAAAENRLTKIELKLDQIVTGKETDAKHWKYLNWTKDCLRQIEHKLDLTYDDFPNL